MEKDTVEYEFYHKDMPPELFKEFIQDQDDTISVATNESARIEPIDEESPEEKIIGGSQGEGELDVEDVFLDQIKSLFQEKTGSLLIDKKYKGFLEIDHHIFAIIDVEDTSITDDNNKKWAIIDEIVNEKIILNIAVSPLIVDLFKKNRVKVVFNILDDSHLLTQLDAIKKYPNDFEVTLPVMKKEYNAWSQKVLTNGI